MDWAIGLSGNAVIYAVTIWFPASTILAAVQPAAIHRLVSVLPLGAIPSTEVPSGTFQSSLRAPANWQSTIATVGLLLKCAPAAAIIFFSFARKVGAQNTGRVTILPP